MKKVIILLLLASGVMPNLCSAQVVLSADTAWGGQLEYTHNAEFVLQAGDTANVSFCYGFTSLLLPFCEDSILVNTGTEPDTMSVSFTQAIAVSDTYFVQVSATDQIGNTVSGAIHEIEVSEIFVSPTIELAGETPLADGFQIWVACDPGFTTATLKIWEDPGDSVFTQGEAFLFLDTTIVGVQMMEHHATWYPIPCYDVSLRVIITNEVGSDTVYHFMTTLPEPMAPWIDDVDEFSVTTSSAEFHFDVLTNGLPTTVNYQNHEIGTSWGSTTSLPAFEPSCDAESVEIELIGLLSNTTYELKYWAQNSMGLTVPIIFTYTTSADPETFTLVTDSVGASTVDYVPVYGHCTVPSDVTCEWSLVLSTDASFGISTPIEIGTEIQGYHSLITQISTDYLSDDETYWVMYYGYASDGTSVYDISTAVSFTYHAVDVINVTENILTTNVEEMVSIVDVVGRVVLVGYNYLDLSSLQSGVYIATAGNTSKKFYLQRE